MMAKESAAFPDVSGRLAGLSAAVAAGGDDLIRAGAPPPIERWDPPFCGDIDIRVLRDGTWLHDGAPIARPALVRLFASVLRKETAGFMLVTPAEKLRIQVEDAPFAAVELAVESSPHPVLRLRTNLDEWITVDAHHPLRFEPGAADGVKPYVLVRGGLEALVNRTVMLDLAALGETRIVDGVHMFGVASGVLFFPMAPASEAQDPA